MTRRPHRAWLVYALGRWWPLLPLTALRVLTILRQPEPAWSALWREGGTALLLGGWLYARWRTTLYQGDSRLAVTQGLLWRRKRHLPPARLAAVSAETTPLLALLGGRRVDCCATNGKRGRLRLYLPRSGQPFRNTRETRSVPRPGRTRGGIVILALSGSNAAVGLLTAIPALRQAARLLGRRPAAEVLSLADRLLTLGLPPLLNTLAGLLLLGWCVSFCRNLLRYGGFTATAQDGWIHTRSGLFPRRQTYLRQGAISALSLRQTLVMRRWGLYAARAVVTGYVPPEGEPAVLVPAAPAIPLLRQLRRLLPGITLAGPRIRPGRAGRRRYLLAPLLWTAAGLLPLWGGRLWRPLAGVWLVSGLWWLAVRWRGWAAAGLTVTPQALVLRYPRGWALYTVWIPRAAIDTVLLQQSPWQRRRGECHLAVTVGGSRRRYRVLALPAARVREALAPPGR